MFLVWENVTIALTIIADSFGIDLYEVGVLVGACFLVNYVTADAKTNWAEGYILVAFYIMIVSNLSTKPKKSASEHQLQ